MEIRPTLEGRSNPRRLDGERVVPPIAWFLAATLLALTGCATTTVMTQRVIDQEALVPPPTGPTASGPMVGAGRVAFEGGVVLSPARASEASRYEGESGHVVLDTLISARIAAGLSERWELGLGVEVGAGSWAHAVPGDLTGQTFARSTFFRAGPQARFLFAGDETLGLGANLEVLLGSVPYEREIYERSRSETVDWTGEVIDRSQWDRYTHERKTTTVWFWRAGLFGTARPFEILSLTAGVMAQTHPYFFGSIHADGVCEYSSGFRIGCDGVGDADDVDPYSRQVIGTSYLTAGLDIGMVTLLGEVYVHFAGQEQVVMASRAGVQLGARVTF